MNEGHYRKKNDLEEYLNTSINVKLYEELTESIRFKGLIDPLAFFNLLDQQYNIVKYNREKPLSVVDHIIKLDLNDKQLHYLLFQLLKLLKRERTKKTDRDYGYRDVWLDNCIKFLDKEYEKMDDLLFPKEEIVKTIESKPPTTYRYDFSLVRSHLNTLDQEKDKIKYLLDRKSQYMQENISRDYSDHPFVMKCDIEIKRIKDHLELDQGEGRILPQFKLSNKKGAKIDLIRILNAFYELHLTTDLNDQIPSKRTFFELFGNFLGVDLTTYHIHLSQALKNQTLEVNLKIFDDMKRVTQDNHYQSDK